jgi:hypothetical protein
MKFSLGTALVIVLCIDLFLFLGQMSVLDINPNAPQIFNYDDSFLHSVNSGDNILNTSDVTGQIPSTAGSISPTTGNLFTDSISTLIGWVGVLGQGGKYLLGIITAPAGFLAMLNLPQAVTYGIGALWFLLTAFLFIGFIMGRSVD